MKKTLSAAGPDTRPDATPDSYVSALRGWRRDCVETLRAAVRSAATLDEAIKWGHLVYFARGPVLLIRAEEERVLFGFWRGQRLREIEPRLKPGGKYEMATLTLDAETTVDAKIVRQLVAQAVALNAALGDPTDLSGTAKPRARATARRTSAPQTSPVRRR